MRLLRLHRLIGLNTWSLVSRTVWEELGGVVLLEELRHWGWALRVQKTPAISSVLLLWFLLADQDVSSHLLPCLGSVVMDSKPSETTGLIKWIFIHCLGHGDWP